ncbi:hypothetical protein [Deinococcus sp. Marseille-Q6407]|nr:hypothetical protein [Deinococcus sp. Marseille-Q6407]
MPQEKTLSAEDLLEIWRVLENLTVTLDRLGHYERLHGEAAACTELRI